MKVLVVIPVYNEVAQLAGSVKTVQTFLDTQRIWDYEIAIAENGSTDGTAAIADSLAKDLRHVRAVHLPLKGRGKALKKLWSGDGADILTYMDVDLSTELAAFPSLVEALSSGKYDVATGSRLLPGAATKRCWKREVTSRAYNRLVKWVCKTSFSDAQCGFKGITKQAARELLPLVEDTGWFFDTELLVIAEKLGYRIFDLPVKWIEDPDSRVRIIPTAWGQLKGLLRVRRNLRHGAYDGLARGCAAATAHASSIA